MPETAVGTYYLEDYAPGRTWTWGTYSVSRDEIITFARQWDPHPFHLDDEATARSVFGGLTAAGVHTIAIENRMFHLDDGPRFRALALLGISDLVLPNPVRVNDRLTILLECISARGSSSKPDCGVAVTRSKLLNPSGEVCLALTRSVLVPCGGAV
jgi:acyl dehydratase